MYYTLLAFRGSESIGEYRFHTLSDTPDAVTEPLRKLKPEFAGVILGHSGVIAHSANLPETNVWKHKGIAI